LFLDGKYSRSGSIAKYKYKSYGDYIRSQRRTALRTKIRTKKHEVMREWIYDSMQKHGVSGKTILCVGARDDCEVDFFTERGYEAIGIDLYKTEKIIKCDMSKMHTHPILKDMRFDVVFACHAMEHCLDFEGFVKSLNLVCKGYFVCMMPYVPEPNWWDCQRPEFVNHVGDEEFDKKLIDNFPGFEIVTNELMKMNTRGYFILKRTE